MREFEKVRFEYPSWNQDVEVVMRDKYDPEEFIASRLAAKWGNYCVSFGWYYTNSGFSMGMQFRFVKYRAKKLAGQFIGWLESCKEIKEVTPGEFTNNFFETSFKPPM